MSSPRRPEVFVSATSADLRTCRQLIKEALLTLGCVPVEQTNFPPDYRTVRDMLRTKIAACDAVVHLAGAVYGAEPTERAPGEPRRSYTQMEYDLARELKKPLYTFVCGEDFAYDKHAPEDDDKRSLQQTHRAALSTGDSLFYGVRSRDDLALRVRELQTHVESLGAELKQTRSWLGRGVMIGLAALLLLGGGLWWLNQRTGKTETKVAQLETELDKQRRYLQAVADVFTKTKAELDKLNLPDDEKLRRAVATIASQEGLTPGELQAGINLFVAAVRRDPNANFMDQALADFAEKKFSAAADNAGKAAGQARDRRLAAEKLTVEARRQARLARDEEREALKLQAQSLEALPRYAEAVQAYEAALTITTREEDESIWANLQIDLGSCLDDWADRAEGPVILEKRARAFAAYQVVLDVISPERSPHTWARLQSLQALTATSAVGSASDPAEIHRLLALAIAGHRAALQVRTQASAPDLWSMSQRNLGGALLDLANYSSFDEAARLLDEAEAMFTAALAVQTREHDAEEWATLQSRLGNLYRDRLRLVSTESQSTWAARSEKAYQAALTVHTRERDAEDWAFTQANLEVLYLLQAELTAGDTRAAFLQQALAANDAGLGVFTRAQRPQEWAERQVNRGALLMYQGEAAHGQERQQRLDAADAALRAAATVIDRVNLPQRWVMLQVNRSAIARLKALSLADAHNTRLEAVAYLESALEILTPELNPHTFATVQLNLGTLYFDETRLLVTQDPARFDPVAAQARRAFTQVIDTCSPQHATQLWARGLVNLSGLLLIEGVHLGFHAENEPGIQKLLEAMATAERLLAAVTREQAPREWALAQLNLGSAVVFLTAAGDPHASYPKAEAALLSAVTVLTEDDFPADWATVQQSLATLHYFQGVQATDAGQRVAHLQKSREAGRCALRVYTAENFPEMSARIQSIQGLAIVELLKSGQSGATVELAREGRAALTQAVDFFGPTSPDLRQEFGEHLKFLEAAMQAESK